MLIYTGQEKLRQLHQIVDDCCKLEKKMIDNLEHRDDKASNPYWETMRKIYDSAFITWLTNQENFKEAKRVLHENNILSSDSELNRDFFTSFEHLCLIMFTYMTYFACDENQKLLLKTRQSDLKKAIEHLRNATKIAYPTEDMPDEFINAKEKLEMEIDNSVFFNYRDKPDLLRTLMAEHFINDMITLYKSKINLLTSTILTDVTICILNMIFDDEITKEYLLKKTSALLKKHKLTTSQECT